MRPDDRLTPLEIGGVEWHLSEAWHIHPLHWQVDPDVNAIAAPVSEFLGDECLHTPFGCMFHLILDGVSL